MPINEHNQAILVRDIPEAGLMAGDVGVVVHIHRDAAGAEQGYILEIFSLAGESFDTPSVPVDAVRGVTEADRVQARAPA
jgi:hypothetical protein